MKRLINKWLWNLDIIYMRRIEMMSPERIADRLKENIKQQIKKAKEDDKSSNR